MSTVLTSILHCIHVFVNSIMPSPKPSLYAAIRLARLVQHFKERLKARVKSHRLSSSPEAVRQHLEKQALDEITGTKEVVKSQQLSHHAGPHFNGGPDLGDDLLGGQLERRSKCCSDAGIAV